MGLALQLPHRHLDGDLADLGRTSDIGGFLGGDIRSASFRELVVRWFQFGAFCPLFRLHGSREPKPAGALGPAGADNEVWSFGEPAYGIIRDLLWLRERLRPYVMAQMRVAHERGTPPMRPLLYDFPDDATAWEVEDQFLLGPDILVAPVTTEAARRRDVYLPRGTVWIDACTGLRHPGGESLVADAPLERIPLYLREGSGLEQVVRPPRRGEACLALVRRARLRLRTAPCRSAFRCPSCPRR